MNIINKMNKFVPSSNTLKPYIKFNILDNPYNCVNNLFKLEFTLPVNITVTDKDKYRNYSLFWDKEKYYKNKNIFKDNI